MKGFDLQCQIVTFKTITAMFSKGKVTLTFPKTALYGNLRK